MTESRLSSLQRRMLELLAPVTPPWTLTGGAALAGFHARHRTTRDLDLFWRDRDELGDLRILVTDRLRDAGLRVEEIQVSRSFVRLRATDGSEAVVLDLVAEPVGAIEAPLSIELGASRIQLDSAHEILVNKLCAVFHRAELRDLQDIQALLDAGGDLARALRDAPRKEGGFSPLTLAWLLRDMPIAAAAPAAGLTTADTARLAAFRDDLVARVLDAARASA